MLNAKTTAGEPAIKVRVSVTFFIKKIKGGIQKEMNLPFGKYDASLNTHDGKRVADFFDLEKLVLWRSEDLSDRVT